MEDTPKQPTSTDVIANMPRRDPYDKRHGRGSPHLDHGELQKIWHPGKPAKPKK
jgi:hypothetical protein